MTTTRLRATLREAFVCQYDVEPTHWAQAPGRVNLIGEHTDYNDGWVLPCAIDFSTVVALRPRADRQVRVLAVDQAGQTDAFALDAPIVRRTDATWPNYVRGMVAGLQSATPGPLAGADLAIGGDVPIGAGLSSSASLLVAVGTAVLAAGPVPSVDSTQLAVLAQRAENDFAGCRCGIMDPLASARGVAGHALLIDCRSLALRPVPLPSGLAVLIVHSNVRRGLVDSAYNLRRAQCEEAARRCGVAALRDLDEAALAERAGELTPTLLRRARHVVGENRRTREAADALAAGDLPRLGALMAASHASMRDDFEITTPAIDALVDLIAGEIGERGGVRMTGGGFGGCVVALATPDLAQRAIERVAAHYRSPDGRAATPWLCRAADGAAAWAAGATGASLRPPGSLPPRRG